MNFTKTMLALAVGSVGIMSAMSAHAAVVNAGDKLSISTGVGVFDANGNQTNVINGSWFGMDLGPSDSRVQGSEKTALSEGTLGLIIGTVTTIGANHGGAPTATDTNQLTAPWFFGDNTGSDWLNVAVTGSTTSGLDLSGWNVAYNGVDTIPMGTGAWTPLNAVAAGMAAGPYTNGIAKFSWDGIYGNAYTLDYTATVPTFVAGFGGVRYSLHLQGVVTAPIPEASTYGMMLAGLGLVGFMASRRRNHA